MSRLRWNSYDDRGPGWRRMRTRGVVAGLAAAAAGIVALTSVAPDGRAATPQAGTALLETRQQAESRALDDAYAVQVRQIEADGARARTDLTDVLVRDLAALDGAAAVAASQREAALADELARLGRQGTDDTIALGERFARDRADVTAFFDDVLTGLGPEGQTPSKALLDAAKRKLETQRSAELSALSSLATAERGLLDASYKSRIDALSTRLHEIDDAEHAGSAALEAAASAAKAALKATTDAVKRQIDADTVTIKARHAQERLDLDTLHSAQLAAVASGAKAALEDRQKREEDQLRAAQANELAAQEYAKRAADTDLATAQQAVDSQRDTDDAALKAVADLDHTTTDAEKRAVSSQAALALSTFDGESDVRTAAVKATYDTAINGITKGHSGVRAAKTERLDKLAAEQPPAQARLTARYERVKQQAEKAAASRDDAAKRALAQDRSARERRHRNDLKRADWEVKRQLGEADRDHQRQLRLLASEYWTLRVRALAFTQDGGPLTDVGSAFDPTTDPGSLSTVATRIGATDLPGWVTGEGVDVALIDTGVVDAPGLAEANVEIGPDFSLEESVPDLRGRDTMGHGTHMAGIIAARDAAWRAGDTKRRPERLLGMAPGARLVSIKTGAADGSVDVTQIIAAINWVIRNKTSNGHNIRVLNLSFGTDGGQDYRTDPLAYAVERAWKAGIVVVVAGGNDGWGASRLTNPAQDPFVLAVGSSQSVDGKENVPSAYSEGTSEGRTVDILAPGRSIVSIRNEGSASDERNGAGRVGSTLVRGSGTSQAAAVTSGAVALLVQARPELTPDQVKHVLKATADTPAAGDERLAGSGYLRVDKAVKAAVPYTKQMFEPSTGSGSLDDARGSVRVVRNGIVLEGQYDVFGRDWSGSRWTEDSWAADSWQAGDWTGSRWTGSRWTGSRWTGSDWTGSRWTTDFWSGSRWTGSRWTSDGFTGSRWTGSRWTGGGWFGAGWDDGPAARAVVGQEPVTAEAEAAATAAS